MDYMTAGGASHPVWWDERVKWHVLLGGTIRGEVRIRGGSDVPESKLARLERYARDYTLQMNLYSSNCRIFAARMRREADRLNAEEEPPAGALSVRTSSTKQQQLAAAVMADVRLVLSIAWAAILPAIYPLGIVALCWEGIKEL